MSASGTVRVLSWCLYSDRTSVWFMYVPSVPDHNLHMAVRIVIHPYYQVDAHHVGGECEESVLRWTDRMEQEGLRLSADLYVHEVDHQLVSAAHDELRRLLPSKEKRTGRIGTLLEEVLAKGRGEPW